MKSLVSSAVPCFLGAVRFSIRRRTMPSGTAWLGKALRCGAGDRVPSGTGALLDHLTDGRYAAVQSNVKLSESFPAPETGHVQIVSTTM